MWKVVFDKKAEKQWQIKLVNATDGISDMM
jgi:hypothetical protein